MVEPRNLTDRLREIRAVEDDPFAALLLEMRAETKATRQTLDEFRRQLPHGGGGNGKNNKGHIEAIIRVMVLLTAAGLIGLFTLLWNLNATMAVQTEQITRIREDFIGTNTERIKTLETRMLSVERAIR